MAEKPTKFEDLKAAELYRSALEDFAVEVEESDKNKKKVLIAALFESGVTWNDYVAQHPEVAPVQEQAVVTSSDVTGKTEDVNVIVQEPPAPQVEDKFLVRMTRDNVRYDSAGYKFTQENPYALVGEETANFLLEKEEGFRLATPAELREFYG